MATSTVTSFLLFCVCVQTALSAAVKRPITKETAGSADTDVDNPLTRVKRGLFEQDDGEGSDGAVRLTREQYEGILQELLNEYTENDRAYSDFLTYDGNRTPAPLHVGAKSVSRFMQVTTASRTKTIALKQ